MTTIDITPAQEEALVAAILALGNLSSVPPKHRGSLIEVRDILISQRHPQKHSIPESELRALAGDR